MVNIPINKIFLIYLKIATGLNINDKINNAKLLKRNVPLLFSKTIYIYI